MDDPKLSGKSKYDLETLMNTARTFTDGIKIKFGKSTDLVIKKRRKT